MISPTTTLDRITARCPERASGTPINPVVTFYISDANAALTRAYSVIREEKIATLTRDAIGPRLLARVRELRDIADAIATLLDSGGRIS